MTTTNKLILAIFTAVNILIMLSYKNSVTRLQNELNAAIKLNLEYEHEQQNQIDCLDFNFSNHRVEYLEAHPSRLVREHRGY